MRIVFIPLSYCVVMKPSFFISSLEENQKEKSKFWANQKYQGYLVKISNNNKKGNRFVTLCLIECESYVRVLNLW